MSSRSARRWTRPLAIFGVGLLTLVVTILALLQLPPVATWVMGHVVNLVPLNPGYRLEVGSVSGDWLHRLALDDVRLLLNDRELARVDRLEAEYDLRRLRGGETRLEEMRVEGARIVARRQGDSWDLAKALKPPADTTGGGGFRVEQLDLRDVQLVAQLSPDSAVRVRGLTLRARDLAIGDRLLLEVDQLNAAVLPPGTAQWFAVATRGEITAEEFRFDPVRVQTEQTRLAGRLVLPRDLDDHRLLDRLAIQLRAAPLAMADLAAIVPSITPEGSLYADMRASGNTDGLVTASLGARLDDATITLNGVLPLTGKTADYQLRGTVNRLDPSALFRAAPAGSVNGRIEAGLQGPALDRSNGRVELRLTPSRLAGTSLERLKLRADLREGNAEITLRGAVEQGTVTASGRIRPFDSIPRYRLSGAATDLPGSAVVARSLAGAGGEPVLDVQFQIAGAGLSPGDARLSGKLDFTAVRQDGDRVSLGHSQIALAGGRLDARPELLVGGGTIAAHVIALLGDTLTYEVRRGTIDRVDLGELVADTAMAPLSGRFALSGRGAAPADAVVSARIAFDELSYGERGLEQVTGSARLAGGRARVELHGSLAGGRLTILGDTRPFDATTTFRLRRARLDSADLGTFLGRPDLAGPLTVRASGTGRWRGGVQSLRGTVFVEPSRLGQIEVSGGTLDARFSGDRLTYDGSIESNAGAFEVAGDGRPLAEVPFFAIRRGRVDSIEVGTLLGRADLRTGLNARFSGTVSAGSADSVQGKLSLDLLPSRINQAQLDSGRVRLELAGHAVRGDVRLEGRDGVLAAELSGRTGNTTQLQADGTLRLERLAGWTGRAGADGRLESSFALNAEGDSAGLVSLGGTINAIGGIGDVRLNALHVALEPDSGAIHIDTLFIRSNVAALEGGGRVALREAAGSDTLRVTGFTTNVAPLAALAGADSISLDSARIALNVSGPAWRWRIGTEIEANRILAGTSLAELVTARGAAAFDSTRLAAIGGELQVKGAAYGKLRIPDARFSGRYDSLLTARADVAVGDSVRLVAAMQGTVGDTLRARLQRLDLTEGDRRWSLEEPAVLQLGPGLTVDGLALRTENRRIIVNGYFDPESDSDIAVRLTNVELDVLRTVGLTPIGGRLDGWLRLVGPAAAPALDGSIGLGIRDDDGKEIGRIRTDLAWNREALRVDATAAPRRGGRLTLNGTFPWGLTLTSADSGTGVGTARGSSDTLALVARADSFDLGILEPLLPEESARDLRGSLVMDTRISGTPEAPKANGTIRVTRAALEIPAIDVSYERGELDARMEGDELRVERLELRTDDEELLTATGVVRLRPLTDPALDLKADLREFRISNSATLQSVASGTVQLGGTVQLPTLTGALTLGRSEIIVGADQASASVEKVELTPEDLRQLARHFGPAVLERADESPGLVDRFRMDLNLRLPGQVWFRKRGSPRADVELSGRVRLRQEPGEPMRFFGRVRPVPGRGTLDVYGREFRLTGGDITLAGPTDSIQLDVTAQYRVPTQAGLEDEGVVVDLSARGQPDSLALEFTADPPMSQDDMLSYIITGRPASENLLADGSAGEESAGEVGAQVALSGLSESLSEAAEEGLGLDVFQLRQEGLYGLTLTAGRYVGSRVFLSMHLPIELGGEPAPGTSLGPSFELEYSVRRWIRANVRGGSVPPRFTLRSRYAY